MLMNFKGESAEHRDLAKSLFELRYDVFVRQRNWSLPCRGKEDVDQYDGPDTRYFCEIDDDGGIAAHIRLTPTLKYSLMADYFPHLVEDGSDPRGAGIYEATRYIVLPSKKSRSNNRAGKAKILLSVFEWAIANGASHIQTVIDTATFPSFLEMSSQVKALGLSHPYGGGPDVVGGGECLAMRCPVNEDVLFDLRTYGGLDQSACDPACDAPCEAGGVCQTGTAP